MERLIKELLDNDFRVWKSPSCDTYIFYSIDDRLGYAEIMYKGAYKYMTVHVPCVECGTGFLYAEDGARASTAAKCCYCLAPHWYGSKYTPQKWNLNSWIKKNPLLVEVTKQ